MNHGGRGGAGAAKLLTAGALATMCGATMDTAHAGGLGRPTPFGARAFGLGGAYSAVADDPTAIHYNPAGLARQNDALILGAETVLTDRSYTPVTESAGEGTAEGSTTTPTVLPVVGYVTRLAQDGIPSRLALGVGLYSTYSQRSRFEAPNTREAWNNLSNTLVELAPAVAYEVNDFLAVGLAFRLGLGFMRTDMTAKDAESQSAVPVSGELSASGLGAGATFGALLHPTERLSVALVYRTSLAASLEGSGSLRPLGESMAVDVEVAYDQRWPQAATVGLGYRFSPRFLLSAQADWTDWSDVRELAFQSDELGVVRLPTEFDDGLAVHLGAEVGVSDRLALRAGGTYETRTMPDRTASRELQGSAQTGVAAGFGYRFDGGWRLDGAAEYLFANEREIVDNSAEFDAAMWADRANVAPGRLQSQAISLELNAGYAF
jgi:long-chain fatty acid transport protein